MWEVLLWIYLVIAISLGLVGLFAFAVHIFFILKGRPEFRSRLSLFLLSAILISSVGQLGVCLHLGRSV